MPARPELWLPPDASEAVDACRFARSSDVEALTFRETPYWHGLLKCRHIGIHRPNERTCNWTARVLTADKRYIQKCLGPALDLGRGKLSYRAAVERAFEWFSSGEIKAIATEAKTLGRTRAVNICPIGDTYTVGHALRDYTEWTRIARSPGGHYNNLVLINYHIVPHFAHVPLEAFTSRHLAAIARQVLETPPRFGFMGYSARVSLHNLSADELRRRKRTFNSLVTILKMAFQHAWNNGHISSERPWRCLMRIPVNHSPRTIFLDRAECRRLLDACPPALRKLVLAALYSGCRVGELGNLKVEDVGREGFGIRVAAFKRGPARFVFLPDEGMAFFLACCDGKSDRDPVLLSEMGLPWRRQHARLFREAVTRAGLPKQFVFHGLRHTYASDLVKRGVPLDIVAKQLGHANTITVSNTYGHLAEHFREEQIRSRFSPLSDELGREVSARRPELDALWQSVQTENWRDYAALRADHSRPRKSYAQTHADVLHVFDAAERRQS